MMGIIWWLIYGLVIGAIAKLIMPGTQGGGWLITIILGIVGAILGGWIASSLFDIETTTKVFDLKSTLFSVGGALLVLFIYGRLTKKR